MELSTWGPNNGDDSPSENNCTITDGLRDGDSCGVRYGGGGAWHGGNRLVFIPGGTDGFATSGGLISDASGNLYGVTFYGGNGTIGQKNGGGTVYEISPANGPTPATETVLYRFTNSLFGMAPQGALLLGSNGVLYGTTALGGANGVGTIFELLPPTTPSGAWILNSLYSFSGVKDGEFPEGGLIMDSDGALYGTTSSGPTGKFGTVFKLSPPAKDQTVWKQTTLFAFNGTTAGRNPNSGLVMDSSGDLYGSTLQGGKMKSGVVFELLAPSPGRRQYKEKVIWSFTGIPDGINPNGQLVFDSNGNLYGTAALGGVGSCDNGAGLTVTCGLVFELSPPSAGNTAWTKQTIWSFAGYPNDGDYPGGGVIISSTGTVYGTTTSGGSGSCSLTVTIGCGSVFALTPPVNGSTNWSERIVWNFGVSNPNDTGIPEYSLVSVSNSDKHIFGVGLSGNGQFGAPKGEYGGSIFDIMP